MDIKELLGIMKEKEASDMFLSVGSVPRARINGAVQDISEQVMAHLSRGGGSADDSHGFG